MGGILQGPESGFKVFLGPDLQGQVENGTRCSNPGSRGGLLVSTDGQQCHQGFTRGRLQSTEGLVQDQAPGFVVGRPEVSIEA